ncbi:hypothetical protein JIN85_15430 [Luteolibacter pohnpeiensis]|uniref:Uncharacterized protein n=1 Tax=Luteolibacter pohnpeiensis TaxID=454153 RepID=A0A934VXG2_9BACT|nr:hypothetical protein [Luteolibacter pohnpeiensis]MBK1883808.1 hypothetical protein [Luteolibacter pohnpeiensis]
MTAVSQSLKDETNIESESLQPQDDLLRFSNGDLLHGTFSGIGNGTSIVWQREDVNAPVEFKSSEVRQVVLRGGRPEASLPSLSNITLVNGDRIAGEIKLLDSDKVTIDTSYAGILQFPRASVSILAPCPLGGRVLYQGPFANDDWKLINPSEESTKDAESDSESPGWKFSGAAWYGQKENNGTALAQKEGMPDRALLRFNVAWRNRFSLAVAFHADFAKPVNEDEDEEDGPGKVRRAGDASSFPWIFGNSYVIQISQSYAMLYRSGFDADGKPTLDPIRSINSNLRLDESGEAIVEIRCDRSTGEISLFVDDQFVSQWSEPTSEEDDGNAYGGKGSGFGFFVSPNNTKVRISDIVMAEWNGMPDAARSLQTEGYDIVLLTNGTDRFSGKVTGVADGKVNLEGRYGPFEFPLDEVAEIRFAKKNLQKSEAPSGNQLSIRMKPIGKISGKPISGDANSIRLLQPFTGEVQVDLSSVVILDFNPSDSFLDDWDEQY